MRLLSACLVLGGCGFSAQLAGDPDPSGSDPTIDAPNPPPTGDGAAGVVTHRIDIAAGKVKGGPHAEFPLLVSITQPDLRPVTAGGSVADAGGLDIYFSSDQAGTSRLAHEVERYAAATGELIAWVKVPMLTAATQLYVHYGDPTITTSQDNPPAVWSAGFVGVWHLSDLGDSTGQNTGTNSGTGTAVGKITGARDFNGNGNVISAGSNSSVDDVFAGGGTAEVWFVATSFGQSGLGRLFDKGPSTTVFSMCDGNVNGALLFGHTFSSGAGNWCTPQNSLALDQWTHVAVVYDASSSANTPTMYINGVAQAVSATSNPSGATTSDASGTLTIGDRSSGGRSFAGRLDEARLSTVSRGATWIGTTYENQRDPAGFIVVQ